MKDKHSKKPPGNAWDEAKRYGIDTTLLEANLKLTPAQRIRNHGRALTMALQLRQGMKKSQG